MQKRKFIKIIIIIVLVSITMLDIRTYVLGNAISIVTVSSEKVKPGENFYLILNLSTIEYTKFQVDITNSQSLTTTSTTGSVSALASNEVVTTFTIDKNTLGLDKLGVVFVAPSNECTVNFSIKVTSLDKDDSALKTELATIEQTIVDLQSSVSTIENSLVNIDETTEEYTSAQSTLSELKTTIESQNARKIEIETLLNSENESISSSAQIEVSASADVVKIGNLSENRENKENMVKNETKEMDKMKDKMKEMEDSEKEMKSKMSNLESNLKDASDKISSLTQGTTYKGSNNNYLSGLTVTGYDLNVDFDKTTNDYFLSVPKDVTSLKINATKEDSSSTVTIYGNTQIVDDKNKIIINVTAANGSVRTYRIYVTK